MKRTSRMHLNAIATIVLVCSMALVFGVTTVQAHATHSTRSGLAMDSALTHCTIVLSGAPWRIRASGGSLAGVRYTLKARGVSCSSMRTWVTRFTHQQNNGTINGPGGFTCRSFSTAASGDKLLYSGVCMHPPHNVPFFEWGPKVPGH